jgi:hypothetical protein
MNARTGDATQDTELAGWEGGLAPACFSNTPAAYQAGVNRPSQLANLRSLSGKPQLISIFSAFPVAEIWTFCAKRPAV